MIVLVVSSPPKPPHGHPSPKLLGSEMGVWDLVVVVVVVVVVVMVVVITVVSIVVVVVIVAIVVVIVIVAVVIRRAPWPKGVLDNEN